MIILRDVGQRDRLGRGAGREITGINSKILDDDAVRNRIGVFPDHRLTSRTHGRVGRERLLAFVAGDGDGDGVRRGGRRGSGRRRRTAATTIPAGTAAATDAQQRKNRGAKNPDVHESSWEEIPTSPARVSSAMIRLPRGVGRDTRFRNGTPGRGHRNHFAESNPGTTSEPRETPEIRDNPRSWVYEGRNGLRSEGSARGRGGTFRRTDVMESPTSLNKKLRWGVLGVARIATRKVIPAMQRGRWTSVDAIASRDASKARAAAAELGVPKAYGCKKHSSPIPRLMRFTFRCQIISMSSGRPALPKPASTCSARNRSDSSPLTRSICWPCATAPAC